jgi:hypothetical protein
MTNREELIKKYIRQQLSEAEKEAFDQFLKDDDQFAEDVQWASKLTAAGDLQLKQSLNAYNRQQRLRWGKYFALAAIALLIVVGIYFKEDIKRYFETKPTEVVTKENLVENNGQIPNPPISKPQITPSVQKPKNEQKTPKNKILSKDSVHLQVNESKKVQQISEDLAYLNSTIDEFRNKEVSAGSAEDDWRQQLFSVKPQYLAALTSIRQEIAQTTDEVSLNKLHLYGGMLNASLPQGDRIEAVKWLEAVMKEDYYTDYAASFLVKTYLELGRDADAQTLLVQYPTLKSKLPAHLALRFRF